MRRLPLMVQEVIGIVEEVYRERNREPVQDIEACARLSVEIKEEVNRIYINDMLRKRFIRGIIEWGVFEKGYTFKRLYNKVFDYLSVFELDEIKERYIKDFLIAYCEYAAKRWSMKVNVEINDIVIKAAKVAKVISKELGITMYEYIRLNQECWDRINQPLSMNTLADESKCRKRISVCKDVEKKRGVIRKEDYKTGVVRRKWQEILDYGVENYLKKSSAKGYLAYVAQWYMEDLKNLKKGTIKSETFAQRYSPEYVENKWKEVEGAIEL